MLLIECVRDKKLKTLTSCVNCDHLKEFSFGATKEESFVKCKTDDDSIVEQYAKRPEEL